MRTVLVQIQVCWIPNFIVSSTLMEGDQSLKKLIICVLKEDRDDKISFKEFSNGQESKIIYILQIFKAVKANSEGTRTVSENLRDMGNIWHNKNRERVRDTKIYI